MTIAKLAVVAVVSTSLAACGGDSNDANSSSTNNTPTNNVSNNDAPPNNATNNTPTNNTTNNTPNNATNNTTDNTPTNNTTNNDTTGSSVVGLAVSADFATMESAWHRIEFADDGTLIDTMSFGTGDVAVSVGQQWAYVVDRNGEQVQVLEANGGLADVGSIDVSGGNAMTNPQFVTDIGDKVYVTLYDVPGIAVATSTGDDWDVVRLDTASLDPDGNPEASAITTDGDFAVVVLQRLENFVAIENSALLVIDSNDDTFVGFGTESALDLGVTNAQANLRWMPGGDLAVGHTGNFGEEDGGILVVNRSGPGEYQVGDDLITETDLGGDLLDFAMLSDTSGLAIVSLPDFSSKLVRFEVSENAIDTRDVETYESPGLAGLDVAPERDWWAAGDRGSTPAFGLVSADDDGDEWLLSASTDLPPAGFAFVE